MVLLSVGDRKSRLEVGGGLGGIVPDSMAGLLLDDMRPALRQNEYGAALLAAARTAGSTIAQSKNVHRFAPPAAAHPVQRATRDSIPWPLIFLGIFFLLMFLRRGGRRPLRRRRRWRWRVLDRPAARPDAEFRPRRIRAAAAMAADSAASIPAAPAAASAASAAAIPAAAARRAIGSDGTHTSRPIE